MVVLRNLMKTAWKNKEKLCNLLIVVVCTRLRLVRSFTFVIIREFTELDLGGGAYTFCF